MTKKIADLFEKYTTLSFPKHTAKKLLQEAVEMVCGERLPSTAISLHHNTALLHVHPIIKTKILTKKQQILEYIKKQNSHVVIDTIQ